VNAATVEAWLAGLTGLQQPSVRKALLSAAAILLVLLLRSLALRLVQKHVADVARHYHFRRALNYASSGLLLLVVARVWFEGLQEIGVFLGLASAGLAISLRDPLVSVAGWLFILLRRPYVIGDRIQVGETFGDVVDIRMFQTYLLECGNWVDGDQATGRIVMVPNTVVFTTSIANYTHGFAYIWDEVTVRLTFESDWKRAKELLTTIAEEQTLPSCEDAERQIREAASEHLIFFKKLTPIVYTSVKEWGIQLTVRYLTPVRQRRGSSQRVWEATLEAFAQVPDISFAYPTTRFFDRTVEDKPASSTG
jgi:small-conductance mechanosensitive channel